MEPQGSVPFRMAELSQALLNAVDVEGVALRESQTGDDRRTVTRVVA